MLIESQDELISYVSKKLNNLKTSYEMRGYLTLIDNALNSSTMLSKYLIEWFGLVHTNYPEYDHHGRLSKCSPKYVAPIWDIVLSCKKIDTAFENIDSEVQLILTEQVHKIELEMKKNIYIKMCRHNQFALFRSFARKVQEEIEGGGMLRANPKFQTPDNIISDMIKNIADRKHTYEFHKKIPNHAEHAAVDWILLCSDKDRTRAILNDYNMDIELPV